MSKISFVIPVFNEEKNLNEIAGLIIKYISTLSLEYEIIFVNDASTDDSLKILKQISEKNQNVKYISFSRNFGQQAALTAGIDFARGDAVISMDADLQDPPELIPEMIKEWEKGNEVVLMRRLSRHERFIKKTTAKLYYALLKRFSDQKITGNIGEFRLVDRKVAKELIRLKEKGRYLRGMVHWMGFQYSIIDFDRPNRVNGETGFTLLQMVRLGMNGILNFSILPLRIGLILGLITILMGISFMAYIIYDSVFNNEYYPLYKWLSVVSLIFMGLLFILIWILGEYIGKIYNEVKNRPIYIISEKGNIEE